MEKTKSHLGYEFVDDINIEYHAQQGSISSLVPSDSSFVIEASQRSLGINKYTSCALLDSFAILVHLASTGRLHDQFLNLASLSQSFAG